MFSMSVFFNPCHVPFGTSAKAPSFIGSSFSPSVNKPDPRWRNINSSSFECLCTGISSPGRKDDETKLTDSAPCVFATFILTIAEPSRIRTASPSSSLTTKPPKLAVLLLEEKPIAGRANINKMPTEPCCRNFLLEVIYEPSLKFFGSATRIIQPIDEANDLPFSRRGPHALEIHDKPVSLEYFSGGVRFQVMQKTLCRGLAFCLFDHGNWIANHRAFCR